MSDSDSESENNGNTSPTAQGNNGQGNNGQGNNGQGNNGQGNISGNIVQITTSNVSVNGNISVFEGNTNVDFTVPIFGNLTLDQTINGNGYIVVNQQGDGVTHTTFDTINPTFDPQIDQNLVEQVVAYYDSEQQSDTKVVMDEIRLYASRIQCDDFHGKGTIDDYNQLFVAAAKIANESKQIKLDVDVEGFNEFSAAADELSSLFNSFIMKLENVSIINDLDFLRAISRALAKIWNLSEVFGKFKQTILATTRVQIPRSAHDTSILLGNVMGEINCAMQYINHFVSPTSNIPVGANLSAAELNVINQAVATIDNWNVLCDQGVSVAMSNNSDIQNILNINNNLKTKTSTLRNATTNLRAKFALYNINRNIDINIHN
jgi:hypothetical protein